MPLQAFWPLQEWDSVRHPPWPLQAFLPAQAFFSPLQPPWPLQAFCPLQACGSAFILCSIFLSVFFDGFFVAASAPWVAMLEPTNPAIAAPMRRVNFFIKGLLV